ncbi:zinc ribbon domain-containing protein [Rugosimonospora africana]|uniref:zinc ribbon domain-containing protein n=1 Tax=Rugosimonospora africana TaxID=556532 RepID=UPI001944510C|nr:zinc ribbon domain-containing protein [Rugosimonospora africana]
MTGPVLSERVGWLADLVQVIAGQVIAQHWADADLAQLAGGVGPDGRALPGKGWMALRRLGWGAVAPEDVVVSDRVRRVAQEEAARGLRLATGRREVIAALLAAWPKDPSARTGEEWSGLRAVLPGGVDNATIRSRTRQISAWVARNGRLPIGLCELESAPGVARQVSLAAADRQQVRVERLDEATVRVWVQLPVCPAPSGYRDWAWHALTVRLPRTVPVTATVCTPTLRPGDGKVRVDLPWQIPHTPPPLTGHTRAVGVDWGLNTLLTCTVADLDQQGSLTTAGGPLRFDATGVSAKLVRLRRHREQVKTKLDHLTRLSEGRPPGAAPDPALGSKLGRLRVEHDAVCARIRHLNQALAWSAARWLVDHASTVDATVIYLEDLTTLEARGGSRSLNRRLSGAVRGLVFTAVTHLAGKAGMTVVRVPARGTSSGCPRCNGAVRHVKAPDRVVAGYRWTICGCGLTMDRDHAAARRIAARGLTNQTNTRRERGDTAHGTIRTATDVPISHQPRRAKNPSAAAAPKPRRDRRKNGPTRTQVRPRTVKTPPLLPLRRQAPAPAQLPQATTGKRPAGRLPQETHQVLQVPTTVPTPPRHPHQVHGALLGHGFHRHVHATPVPAAKTEPPRNG